MAKRSIDDPELVSCKRLVLGANLGQGTTSIVRLVEGDASRALKVIRFDVDDANEDAFVQEIHAYGTIGTHPCIAHLYEYSHVIGDRGMLLMEAYGGGTLYQRLAAPIVPELAARMALELMAALAHCHRQLVVHRDVKPENMLLTTDGHVRLCDFGMAHVFATKDDGRRGAPYEFATTTIWYMPPEVLFPEAAERPHDRPWPRHSYPLDMWSAGCVVAELAGSHALFAVDSYSELMQRQLTLLGTPTAQEWPDGALICTQFPRCAPRPLALPTVADAKMRALVRQLVCMAPAVRLTAKQACQLLRE